MTQSGIDAVSDTPETVGGVDYRHSMLVVAWLALVVALGGVLFAALAWKASADSAESARVSAKAVADAERRDRTPVIEVTLRRKAAIKDDRVIFELRNAGPQDLDSLVVYRPQPDDRIKYPLALVGVGQWADSVDAGPLAIHEQAGITLSIGVADKLPTFRLRLEARASADEWIVPIVLPEVREYDITKSVY